jgi:hypothetical protein
MPISEVPYVIQNETKVEKIEVVKTQGTKTYLTLRFKIKHDCNSNLYNFKLLQYQKNYYH